jgi:hypothetical protein
VPVIEPEVSNTNIIFAEPTEEVLPIGAVLAKIILF